MSLHVSGPRNINKPLSVSHICECITLFINVDGDFFFKSDPESGIIDFNEHFNHPCIPFLEMDIDFRVERAKVKVVESHGK